MDVEEISITIRDAIRDLPKRYESNENDIKNLESEINDLMHLMELVDLNARDGFKAYKELQRVQQERRKIKDENEELKHLYPALKGLRDRVGQFDNAVGGIRKTRSYLEKRKYRCRIRKDLENRINGVIS